MRNFSIKRFTASLLLIVMLVAAVPATMFNFAIKASAAEDESATIIDAAIFFSDLHTHEEDLKGSSTDKTSVINGVFGSLKANGLPYSSINSCGDAFSVNNDSGNSGFNKFTGLTGTVSGWIRDALGNTTIPVNYTWSDHDRYAVLEDGTTALSKDSGFVYGAGADNIYGTDDDANYYVYTLSMADLGTNDRYKAGFHSNTVVTETINAFKASAAALKSDRPILIASHMPLYDNRNDNGHAYEWAVAINEVAETKDVVYFHGHNHKYDAADGSEYYFAKGSTMSVCSSSSGSATDVKLNFTHINTGYLEPKSSSSYSSSTTRMNVAISVEIYDQYIGFVTYGTSGKYTGSFALDEKVERINVSGGTEEEETPSVPGTSVTDNVYGVTVSASNITALSVEKVTVQLDEKYHTSVSYDIRPEGYTQGTVAAVTIPVDTTVFDVTKPVCVLYEGEIIAITNIASGKVTFTTDHFSVYTVAQTDEEIELDESKWVTITTPGSGTDDVSPRFNGWVKIIQYQAGSAYQPATTKYVYTLDTNGVSATDKYLIVGSNSANAMVVSGSSLRNTSVEISGNTTITTDDRSNEWTIDANGRITNGTYWLTANPTRNNCNIGVSTSASDAYEWTVAETSTSGNYTISAYYSGNRIWYLNYNGGWTTSRQNSPTVRLYGFTREEKVDEIPAKDPVPGLFYKLTGTSTYNATVGMTADEALALVKAGVTLNQITTTNSNDPSSSLTGTPVTDSAILNNLTYTWATAYNNAVAGDYAVTISYDGKTLGTAEVVVTTVGLYAQAVGGNSTLYAPAGSLSAGVIDTAKQFITVYTTTDKTGSSVSLIPDDDSKLNWTATQDTSDLSKWTVTVSYDGKTLKEVDVEVQQKTISKVELSSNVGNVERGSTETDTKLIITYEDGTTAEMPVTTGMITAGSYNVGKNGTYTGLTVSYAGYDVTDYTLKVVNITGVNDYPAYPNPGSVKVDKTATGLDFQNTGLAKIQLSASGLPAGGVDVVVVIDTGSSMSGARLTAAANALNSMLTLFMQSHNTYGTDIDVSVVGFNGFNGTDFKYITGASLTNEGRTTADSALSYTTSNGPGTKDVYDANGNFQLGAENFMNVSKLTTANINTITGYLRAGSGTNYDGGLSSAYRLLAAKKAANTSPRQQFVVFMSDGAGFLYNGFMSPNSSSNGGRTYFNRWLQGEWASVDAFKEAINNNEFPHGDKAALLKYAEFYNGNGENHPNRIAEAIKGEPGQYYGIVRSGAGATNNYMEQWEGLGATIYSVGLEMADDAQGGTADGVVTMETLYEVINVISSGTGYGYPDATNEQLANVFSKIAAEINIAASNARFVDQLGSAFELQMNPTQWSNADKSGVVNKETDITVTTHSLYTEHDVGKTINGHTVTQDDIGKPYGTGTTVETVKFIFDDNNTSQNPSDDKLLRVESSVKGVNTNILNSDGVICAQYFFYNTTNTTKVITLADGSTYNLPAETFYWNIGSINETQFTLTYTVYLTGALNEGGAPAADSYATNNFAILYYDNYVGNSVSQSVASPTMAWSAAKVSYAFYLVNSEGKPVYKDGSIAPNFYTAYKVTRPIVYSVVELNNNVNVIAGPVANNVLPAGYTLYAPNVSYTVGVASGKAQGAYYNYWVISNGGGATYVTGYGSATDYTNKAFATSASVGSTLRKEQYTFLESDHIVKDGESFVNYDYANTVVWFPVLWVPSTIPDTIVIDFGLSVDITVLENDQFGTTGKLTGLCSFDYAQNHLRTENNEAVTLATINTVHVENSILDSNKDNSKYPGTYGDASIINGKIRYTPKNMTMGTFEQFVYEVYYSNEYYYGVVTVIPATNIYYEEYFVTLTNAKALDENGNIVTDSEGNDTYVTSGVGAWVDEGTKVEGVQDEDRPGKDSPFSIDHDNVYGHDEAYTNYNKFSLGAAKKVSVNAEVGYHKDNSPTAKFTFTGTGFDIISMTNSDSGVIFITATNRATKESKNKFVDNYYGYTYDETNGWTPAPDPNAAIYQVPVMKFAGLPYGTYDVTIWVTYSDYFDHDTAGTNGTPGYSFWLDSIRIYDPAGTNIGADSVIGDAYGKDNESNPLYLEIGDAILPSETEIDNGAKLPGIVFIDGNKIVDATTGTNIPDDYAGPGPNNEVYLLPGHVIAFRLISNATPLDVQIGVKLAFGDTANVKIAFSENSHYELKLDTATDMYYSIGSYLDDQQSNDAEWESVSITVANTSTTEGTIISLTNIKATFKNANCEINGMPGTPVEISFVTDTEVIENAAAVVTKFFASKPKPVLEVFDPETLAYTVVSGIRGINTVRVITSNDADAITVNGIEAKKTDDSKIIKSMVKMLDKLYGDKHNAEDYCVWTVEVKSAPVYDIVAFRIVEIPDPSIDAPAVFEPETVAHTVISNINGTNTVRVITSKDVSSIIVNGVKAEKINDAKILKSMVKMLDKLYDDKHNESDYYVWTVDVKSAASYDIVAFNEDGVSTIPAIENTKNVSNK